MDSNTNYEMEELLLIVSKLARKYTGGESTSVTYEKAQMLMEAVLFCLQEYHNSSAGGLARKDISVKEQYDIGAKLVYEKVEKIRKIFNELQFEDFGVKCLHDTVQEGIPQFLKWYDIKFCPQDMLLTLDYPALIDCNPLAGADAVYEYIRAIQIEQRFLGAFDRNYVVSVLNQYDPKYRSMIENICSIVLINTIGHIVLKKPLQDAGFLQEESLQLSKIFGGKSVSETEQLVRDRIGEMVGRFFENDGDMLAYLCGEANNIAVRIDTANQENILIW